MNIKEINAKTILRKHKRIDSWFVSKYGMNLYRGCIHNCVYCDGRTEKYNINGEFGCDIEVKINALDILNKELQPRLKKKPINKEYIMMGGGVGDSYQPVEKDYLLTQKALKLINNHNFPVNILTKSTLVERDIDLISEINENKKAIVSMSFSSTDDEINRIFELGVPTATERLKTLKKFKKQGIATGMFLMPVIPFITDKADIMHKTISDAKKANVDFIIFSGMTLKTGRQKNYFMNVLKEKYPDLLTDYSIIYKNNKWGGSTPEYYHSIHKTFSFFTKKYDIPVRIPSYLFKDFLTENDLVIVILDQMDYLLKLQGKKSPYGYAAYSISKLSESLSKMKNQLRNIKGVGPSTEKIIIEILETKSSEYYENLIGIN